MWALHYHPHEAFRCHNRPALIEYLADALLEYECALHVYAQNANTLQELAQQTVKNAEIMAEAYARLLRRRPEAPTPGRQRPRVPRVTEAVEVLRSMEQGISSTRNQQLEKAKNTWRSRLAVRMYALCERYGPAYKSYPDVAVYRALAAILLQLGVEEGDNLDTVASRIRIRRTRHTKPPTPQS
jgi:hypothetical protein